MNKPCRELLLRKNIEIVKGKLSSDEEKDVIRNFKIGITGVVVMQLFDMVPCSEIGILKEYVKEAILEGEIPNEFEAADRLMREKAAEMGLFPKEN